LQRLPEIERREIGRCGRAHHYLIEEKEGWSVEEKRRRKKVMRLFSPLSRQKEREGGKEIGKRTSGYL